MLRRAERTTRFVRREAKLITRFTRKMTNRMAKRLTNKYYNYQRFGYLAFVREILLRMYKIILKTMKNLKTQNKIGKIIRGGQENGRSE